LLLGLLQSLKELYSVSFSGLFFQNGLQKYNHFFYLQTFFSVLMKKISTIGNKQFCLLIFNNLYRRK